MKLKYKIRIKEIPKEEGGGFNACVDELGKFAVQGDGVTPKEALENLLLVTKSIIKHNDVKIKNGFLIVNISEEKKEMKCIG